MYPLVVALRRNPNIRGVMVGSESLKLALYADKLLMYVSFAIVALPNKRKKFERFGALSNFRVNTPKSELLNISLPHTQVSSICLSFPFQR